MENGKETPEGQAPRDPAERASADFELLFRTLSDLTSTLSSREVIERLVDRTLLHLRSEIASVLLLDRDGTLRILYARGLPVAVVENTRMRAGEGIAGHVFATGEPLLVPDVETDPVFRRKNHERYYTNSCISAPLLRQGRAFGVLNVNNKRSREVYTGADLRVLEAIASVAAVALGNAQRFEEVLARAQYDALTGLANHGYFWISLETEVKRASRHQRPLALVMFDIDHFKAFNDRLGHLRGDMALAAVGRALAGRSRAHDLAARYGGDEFAVLLPETGSRGAVAFAEKIRLAVETLALAAGGDAPDLSVSGGVATLSETDGTGAGLVEAADARLYRAKALGRNRICAHP